MAFFSSWRFRKFRWFQRLLRFHSLLIFNLLRPHNVLVCLVFFFLFYVQSNCGRFISKNETPPGFAVGMLRSPKTEFQGKPYGLHSLLLRSDKACFFFLFPSKVILIIHAFKWLHAKLCQHSRFFAMPIANRNTEVSLVVSGDCQQKHILRVIVALTRP